MMECWEHFALTLAICLGNYIGTYMTCLVFGEEEELTLQKDGDTKLDSEGLG